MADQHAPLHWRTYAKFLVAVIAIAALLFIVAPLFIPRTATTSESVAAGVPEGFPPEAPTPSPSDGVYDQKGFEYLVSHDDNGFVPDGLSIAVGETVRFVQTGSTPLQVSVQGQLSESLLAGMYFEHAFDEAGTFEYRNAIGSSVGTVIVN